MYEYKVEQVREGMIGGKISADNITRPGGKIFMTGDQLARLIASWSGQPAPSTEAKPAPRRRVRRHDPHKPPAGVDHPTLVSETGTTPEAPARPHASTTRRALRAGGLHPRSSDR